MARAETGAAALQANSRNAFLAGLLGWTFDAFDFFVLTYVVGQVATNYGRSISAITFTLTASLLTRPLGAILFGMLADRYGRRIPLMLDVLFYSVIEVCSGLAPSYGVFLFLRLLYGIGMGGAWGLGASLALEAVPAERRGLFSGILQEGYAAGNLLAAFAFRLIFPHFGWRPMFFLGIAPALVTLGLLWTVEETNTWKVAAGTRPGWGAYLRTLFSSWKILLYLVVFMAFMGFMSHGTQDLYPTFLQQQRHLGAAITSNISVLSMVGAITGGICFGTISDRIGRRYAMVAGALLALLMIPLWVFAPTTALIALGAFLLQFMVQGAWGVVPAHANELSPPALRGFLPGFSYQVGILFAAGAPYLEARLTQQLGYAKAMGGFAAATFVIGALVIGFGPEAHRISFRAAPSGKAGETT